MMSFWDRISTVARARKIPLTKIADATGISYRTIQTQKKNGKMPNDPKDVKKVLDYLGITFEYLMSDDLIKIPKD